MSNKKTCYRLTMFVIFFLIFLFSANRMNAQIPKEVQDRLQIPDSTHVQIITMHDKSTMMGRIVKIEETELQFKTDFGELTIPIQKIMSIALVPVSSIKSGQYWFPNPNATRLFFAPTGRMLKKKDGYFADYYLLFPAVAYGITNNITIGGGMSLIPGVDIDRQIFYFTPKIGLTAGGNLNLALGALIIKIPDFDDDESDSDDDVASPLVGLLYGVGTYGTVNSSLTLGLGYGFVDDKVADKPMVVIGGEQRISRRLALVTENWIMPGVDYPLISYGLRFFSEKLSVDLAFLNTTEDPIFPGIPYIDFVFNF